MPLNDLFKDPFLESCETGSDRAPKHEAAHFTSSSLPDLPSGSRTGPPLEGGIICPKAKYPTNQNVLRPKCLHSRQSIIAKVNDEFV